MSRGYLRDGIILASKDYGEADKILMILTKENGLYPVLTKGSRRLKSRKRGHLSVFNKIKFSAQKRRGFDIMLEVETISDFVKFRDDLKRISVAYYFSEVLGRLVKESSETSGVLMILEKYLEALGEEEIGVKKLRERFVCDVLVALGFWPQNKEMKNPDKVLEVVAEKNFSTIRVGKKILS